MIAHVHSDFANLPSEYVHISNNTIDWGSVQWEKLTPEDKWRLDHIKMHELHRGHESMHAEMVFVLLLTLIVCQIFLVKWKQTYPSYYHKFTLLGMWIIPTFISLRQLWWRFIILWCIFSLSTGFIMNKAWNRGSAVNGNVPRTVYKWFLIVYKISYACGIFGYFIVMATLCGFNAFAGVKPHVWMDVGLILLFYALYFGVLSRDIAELCAVKMVTRLGYHKPEGIPERQLESDVCALCGQLLDQLEIKEATCRLSCSHVFHEFCIRGWCIVGKKETCPYCHEKVHLKRMFPNPWEKPHLMYGQLLDWLRWLVCWQPIILVIAQTIYWILGLE